jgi:hypothetical protein
MAAFREEEVTEPEQVFVERKMQALLAGPNGSRYSVNDLVRIRNQYEAEHKQKAAPEAFRINHPASHARLASRKALQNILFPQ